MWSVLVGLADVSANAWRKRLRKASDWLDWLLQEVLAMASPVSPWLARAGLRRILLIDGTHWKCFGPQGIVMRVHTAFDLLAGRLTQIKVTDCHEGEHLVVFDLQKGDLVVTDRANGLRKRIVFVLSKLADIVVRISPSKFPMEDEQGAAISVLDWLKGLQASAGQISSRAVWITYTGKRFQLRLIAFRLSQEQQEKAERRTKRKASKKRQKVQSDTLSLAAWVVVVTTLPQEQWSDQQILRLYQARWHIENRLHWRRDVTLHEDQSQVRSAGKPPVLAALNNIVLALMDWLGVRNVPEQMRIFAAFPRLALTLLLGSLTFE